MREFDISVVLSIVPGRLVAKNHMSDIYDILNYMGNLLYGTEDDSEKRQEIVEKWVDTYRKEHGDMLAVAPLPKGDHEFINPIQEAIDLAGEEKVIVIQAQGETDE
jgi:hypothetical protein